MKETGPNLAPEFDSENGFEIVWKSNPQFRRVHSLVKVPLETPISVLFSKPLASVNVTLTPNRENQYEWFMTGKIDANIINDCKLPITYARRPGLPPHVTDEDMEKLRIFGKIERVSNKHFDVALILKSSKVNNLFISIWNPQERGTVNYYDRPRFDVDAKNGIYRILPQLRGSEYKKDLKVVKLTLPHT